MLRAATCFVALMLFPVLASAQQPCTTDARRVVDELYRHMLERTADASSTHWVQQLESGRMTVRDVVREISTSQEHLDRFFYREAGEETPYFRSVGRFYRHLLGRQPDEAGARSFAQLAQRRGPGAVADSILSSREYEQQFGSWGVPGSGGVRYCASGNVSAEASTSAEQTRFEAWDRNNDGIVSRAEWRGSRQSFDVHDWNNDGSLSGDELRVGAVRAGRTPRDMEYDSDDRFEDLDVNGNGRIEPREWHGSVAAFNRLDVDNNNVLSRAEVSPRGFAVPTAGQQIVVSPNQQWTDTGITVRQGDLLTFDVDGQVQLSSDSNDMAHAAGALSGRRASNAPLPQEPAGALIGRIDGSGPFGIGNQRSLRAPASGRLSLGINDDHLPDNSGRFQVIVDVR